MEHRLSPRIPCPFPVTIDHLNLRLPSCAVADASRDGLSVLTRGVQLPTYVVVNVTIKHDTVNDHLPNSRSHGATEKVPALVVYSTSRQAGLWFYKDKNAWAGLWDLITSNQAPSVPGNGLGAGRSTYRIGAINDL